jgi:hypothetical protein
VLVRRASDNRTFGQGVTGPDGKFTINWSTTENAASFALQVTFQGFHKDARFFLLDEDGDVINMTKNVTLETGQTEDIGQFKIGSAGAPNKFANLYDALFQTWQTSLLPSNLMFDRLKFVQVRAFGDFDDKCPGSTSCAFTKDNVLWIGNVAAFSRFTAAHELGHIASFKSDNHQTSVDTCFPKVCTRANRSSCCDSDTPNVGHSFLTKEHLAVAFEEGFADHVANMSLWSNNAVAPHICNGSGPCPTTNGLELSFGAGCQAGSGRQELQVVRFLWDLYDNRQDFNFDDDAFVSRSFFFDTVKKFTPGFDDHDADEVLTSTADSDGFREFDNKDGRSADDFLFYAKSTVSQATLMHEQNCLKKL